MKKYLAIVPMVALCLFSACKGRTNDNVEPTGDTVEVKVETDSVTRIVTDSVVRVVVDTVGAGSSDSNLTNN